MSKTSPTNDPPLLQKHSVMRGTSFTVNSLSGGKTSSYMAYHHPADLEIFACICIDDPLCSPKDPIVMKYALDKLNGNFIATAERPATLKVMMDLEQLLGREIKWVRGISFDEVIDKNSSLPSWNRRFCTTIMKILPIFEYCYARHEHVEMRIGFRGDELDRIINSRKNLDLIKYPRSQDIKTKRKKWETIQWREKTFPLAKTYHLEIIKFWEQFDIVFPFDSNCAGCHHKLPELIKANWIEDPPLLNWFSRQEKKKAGRKIHTWHDSMVTYEEIFKMNFTEFIKFDRPMCNSGYCTD